MYRRFVINKGFNEESIGKSTLTPDKIEELAKQYQLVLPEAYKLFIGTAFHNITELTGNFDNFLFENDVSLTLEIPPQPKGNELKYISQMLKENRLLTDSAYLPLGIFDKSGCLCIDTHNANEELCIIKWLDFENCIDIEDREEFEEEAIIIFETFEDFLECFFKGSTQYVPD